MITFFTTLKPLKGHDAITQANALKSWRKCSEDLEILVFGKTEGVETLLDEVKAVYIPEIELFEGKVPYVDTLFTKAQEIAKFQILCYLNADILVPPHFTSIIPYFNSLTKFLAIGHRFDLDIQESIEFKDENKYRAFWKHASMNSVKHAVTGIDYFLFRKGTLEKIPHFRVGRIGWDNWMVWHARRNFKYVIDCTPMIQVIHQNHEYTHLQGGKSEWASGKDAQHNLSFLKHRWSISTLLDTNWVIESKGLRKKNKPEELEIYYDRLWRIYPEIEWILIQFRRIQKHFKKKLHKFIQKKTIHI